MTVTMRLSFVDQLTPVMLGLQHNLRVQTIHQGRAKHLQRQLTRGPQLHGQDLVKVTDGPHAGRWGQVVDVIDYRHTYKAGADNSHLLTFLIMVALLSTRPGHGIVEHPPGSVPFEEHEIAPLFDSVGTYVRAGRVVPADRWPVARDGYGT